TARPVSRCTAATPTVPPASSARRAISRSSRSSPGSAATAAGWARAADAPGTASSAAEAATNHTLEAPTTRLARPRHVRQPGRAPRAATPLTMAFSSIAFPRAGSTGHDFVPDRQVIDAVHIHLDADPRRVQRHVHHAVGAHRPFRHHDVTLPVAR